MAYAIRLATTADIPAMVPVINAAFSIERHIVADDRTSPTDLAEHFEEGQFLLVHDGNGTLAASVYLEPCGERAYMGMLAVHPAYQGVGLARLLTNAVEECARHAGCKYLDMYVLSVHAKLLSLYRRFGYTQTGARTPHPEWAHRLKVPCYLIQLSKLL